MPKTTQGKSTPTIHSGRKSRKSQPKRNIRQAEIIDSDEDSGAQSAHDMSSASWRERSVSSVEEAETSNRETSDMDTSFDLSKVKHEVDEGDDIVRAKQNDKGKFWH